MTDEVRTTSATGGQKGVKRERFSLMPRRGLEAIARVFHFGASKYADHNWRHGYEWSKSIDALERHVQAFKDGETFDDESGLPHLAHAGFHVLVLLTWLHDQGEGVDNPMDDRWPASMERVRRAKAELAAREAREEAEAQAADLEGFHAPTPPPTEAQGEISKILFGGPDLPTKRKACVEATQPMQVIHRGQVESSILLDEINAGARRQRLTD